MIRLTKAPANKISANEKGMSITDGIAIPKAKATSSLINGDLLRNIRVEGFTIVWFSSAYKFR